jgi:hypothetical protein
MNRWTADSVDAWARQHLVEPFGSRDVMKAALKHLGSWSSGQGVLAALRKFNLVHRTQVVNRKGKRILFEYRFGPEPPTVDTVAKRIALTTLLTYAAAKHGLQQLMERGATVGEAETIVRLGVAPVAAELLDRMRDEHARLHGNGDPGARGAGGPGNDNGRLAGEAPEPRGSDD